MSEKLISGIIEFLHNNDHFCFEDIIDPMYGDSDIESKFLLEFETKMSDQLLISLCTVGLGDTLWGLNVSSALTREQKLELLRLNPTRGEGLSFPFLAADIKIAQSSSRKFFKEESFKQVEQEEIDQIRKWILNQYSPHDWIKIINSFKSKQIIL